jgi:hypothetical protein
MGVKSWNGALDVHPGLREKKDPSLTHVWKPGPLLNQAGEFETRHNEMFEAGEALSFLTP